MNVTRGLDASLMGLAARVLRNGDFADLMLGRGEPSEALGEDGFTEDDRHNFLLGCWFTTTFLTGLVVLPLSPRLPPRGVADALGVVLTALVAVALTMALVHGLAARVPALRRAWDSNAVFAGAAVAAAGLTVAAFYT